MPKLSESSTTAVECEDSECTECIEKGWTPRTLCNDDPGISRGPHKQCTEASSWFTPKLAESDSSMSSSWNSTVDNDG